MAPQTRQTHSPPTTLPVSTRSATAKERGFKTKGNNASQVRRANYLSTFEHRLILRPQAKKGGRFAKKDDEDSSQRLGGSLVQASAKGLVKAVRFKDDLAFGELGHSPLQLFWYPYLS